MSSTLTAVARAARKSALAAQDRDDTIRQAAADGHTLRAIAAAAGLSHGRIFQIVKASGRSARTSPTGR